VERVNRTLRDKLYKHFLIKIPTDNSVLPKFVQGINATFHIITGMAPTKVSETDVLSICNRMNEKAQRLKRLARNKISCRSVS
jgi:hypothetical protein